MTASPVPPASRVRYPDGHAGPWRRLPSVLVMGGDEQAGRFAVEALGRAGFRAEIASDDSLAPEWRDFILLQDDSGGVEPVLRLRERGFRMPILLAGAGPGDEFAPGDETGVVERLRTPYTLQSLREAILRLGIPISGRGRSL